MKILIVNISLRDAGPKVLFPIGLGYICTAVKRAGYDFDLLDLDAHKKTAAELEAFFATWAYDVVCLGCIVTGYRFAKRIAALARQANPDVRIIVGNSVATSIPQTLLTQTEADVVVMGEGDETVVDLLQALEEGASLSAIPGIVHKRDGRIKRTPDRPHIADISAIPMIDYTIFDMDIYLASEKHCANDPTPIPRETIKGLQISTARGCVANCTFCYHVFKGRPYRFRRPEAVLAEVGHLIGNYGVNYIEFADELTFFSKRQAREFAQAILDSGLSFFWTANCRAGLFDSREDLELLALLKRAGCVGMAFSLENADPEILAMMRKHITPEQFVVQTRLIREAGLSAWTSLVFGYPQETPASVARTFDVCIEAQITPSVGFLLPQPGSVMYDYARERGVIADEEAYLMRMGDRQDFLVNLTAMSDDAFQDVVREETIRLYRALGIAFDAASLYKTRYLRTGEEKTAGK